MRVAGARITSYNVCYTKLLRTSTKATKSTLRIELAAGTPNPDIDFGFNVRDVEGNPAGEIAWSDVFNVIRRNNFV